MLEIARDGAIKTRIMYKAFLSFPQLKEYLDILMKGGLLRYDKETRLFFATEKGKQFIANINNVEEMLPKAAPKRG